MFCEVVRAVLFACGGTPTHPFVMYVCLPAAVQARLSLARSRLLRPSRGRGPSQSELRSATEAESTGTLRLALRPRGPLLREEEGPMQPRYYNSSPPLVSLGASREPPLS